MDLLHFLNRRLSFIQTLYQSATPPFEEIKQKIEAHEPPYVHDGNPNDYDGDPHFLSEWQEADDSIMVIGHWCLCMVQVSLQCYLRDCISPIGALWWNSSALVAGLGEIRSKKRRESWFECYRLLFQEGLRVDWGKGPVSLADLEQLNLTRNDLIHNIDMLSFNVERVEEHAKRFPIGLFTDDLWRGLDIERVRIRAEQLVVAVQLVTDFCTWLDGIRCRYPQYLKQLESGVEPKAQERKVSERL